MYAHPVGGGALAGASSSSSSSNAAGGPPVAARAEIVRTPIVKHIGKAEIVVELIGVKYVYDSLEDDLREHFDARQGPEWNILLMRRGQDTADGDVAYHIVYRETSL